MLHLMRVEMVINSPWMLSKNWLVQKQTAFGKDISNPFMADNLPKIVWFSTHHVTFMKSWLVQKQTALDDAEGVVCLLNEEIFAGLAQMGYEKPSTKLTFYKAFFSSQWKFLIHTILQSLSAKSTSWNEFSTTMDSVVICLSKGQKFNFSKYIFDSLVRNVDSSSKFYMYPCFIQLIIQNQVGNLSTHTTRFISPALTQKVFANMRRVGKGFSGVETPLFEGMLADRPPAEKILVDEQVQVDDDVAAAVEENVTEDVAHDAIPSPPSHDIPSPSQGPPSPPQQPHRQCCSKAGNYKAEGKDADIAESEGRHAEQAEKQTKIYNLDLDHSSKVLSMQEDDSEVQEVVEVVTTANLITDVVTATASQVSAASTTIPTASATIPAAALTVVAAYTRRRKGMIIRDPEEGLPLKTLAETPKVKDKGKGILVETPKPMKKKDQIELDAEYARKLHEEINRDEFNKDIDWDAAMDHAAKRRKLSEEAQEAKDLRKRLEVVDNEDDDVFIEATLLARKVPVVDYQIVLVDNKPRFKIIKADETHQFYISFTTLLKNFDREDLKSL
nr:hypothetical protein [Tanacetum cinerariifolium]